MNTSTETQSGAPTPENKSIPTSPLKKRWLLCLMIIVLIIAAAYLFARSSGSSPAEKSAKTHAGFQRPIPVTAVATKKADIAVFLNALGTVTPVYTVTVRSQVGGQLMRVHFKEGQIVKKGELLAEIDVRPFQIQLMQAEGQLAKDEALLKNAESDLIRYKQLLAQDSIAEQQVTTQESLVRQYRGAVKTDRGQIASANLQITFARIMAPVAGRIGLRQIDPGNMVQTSDTNGLAVITQLQPITVVFSVPQDNLPLVLTRLRTGEVLPVYAYSQDGKTLLATGKLHAVDNQIETTTGTVKMKALFENRDHGLFPNQFVNVRMKVDTLKDATVMPTAAVQRGSVGSFVYLVKADRTATVRPIQLGPVEGENVAVTSGLVPGESVVTIGGDKLREGTKVEMGSDASTLPPGRGKKALPEGSRKDKP